MKRIPTHSQATREALGLRRPFTTYGALRAVGGYYVPFGDRLPQCWRERYRDDGDEITYTVLSYQTPIAWVLRSGEVVVPEVKYSQTTTEHQRLMADLRRPPIIGTGTPDILSRIDDVLSRPVPRNSGEGAIYSPEYLGRSRDAEAMPRAA